MSVSIAEQDKREGLENGDLRYDGEPDSVPLRLVVERTLAEQSRQFGEGPADVGRVATLQAVVPLDVSRDVRRVGSDATDQR